MSRLDRMEALLKQSLETQEVQVIDQSHLHEGHAGARPGGETHYQVRVVSDQFEGLGRVQRHRRVYDILQAEFENGLHALSVEALTPAENK